MNQEVQALIEAIRRFDHVSVEFVRDITNRLALMDYQLEPRHEFLITAALARLREARMLYCAAMGLPLTTQGVLGVEELQIHFQDVHATFESNIADAIPVGEGSAEDIERQLDERTTAFNTLDHAEIACLSALTHLETLNEFLTAKKANHEK